jgi:carbon-monoxide dehydrogenase medium subunit
MVYTNSSLTNGQEGGCMPFSLSGLPAFEYYQPTTICEALTLLHDNPSAKVYLGGTDLFPRLRKQTVTTNVLIDLKWINDFPETMINTAGDLLISPLTTFSHLEAYLGMVPGGEVLANAIQQLGTRSLRNRATLAGNICNASPAADSAASLLVYDAKLTLQSLQTDRETSIKDYFQGAGKTVLQANELLTQIKIPAQNAQCKGTYLKISRNKAADLAICGVAVLVCPSSENKCGFSFRLAVSGANVVPVLAVEAADFLSENEIQQSTLQKAARMAADAVMPLSDVRSSREYRSEMVYQLTILALTQILQKPDMEVML